MIVNELDIMEVIKHGNKKCIFKRSDADILFEFTYREDKQNNMELRLTNTTSDISYCSKIETKILLKALGIQSLEEIESFMRKSSEEGIFLKEINEDSFSLLLNTSEKIKEIILHREPFCPQMNCIEELESLSSLLVKLNIDEKYNELEMTERMEEMIMDIRKDFKDVLDVQSNLLFY